MSYRKICSTNTKKNCKLVKTPHVNEENTVTPGGFLTIAGSQPSDVNFRTNQKSQFLADHSTS